MESGLLAWRHVSNN